MRPCPFPQLLCFAMALGRPPGAPHNTQYILHLSISVHRYIYTCPCGWGGLFKDKQRGPKGLSLGAPLGAPKRAPLQSYRLGPWRSIGCGWFGAASHRHPEATRDRGGELPRICGLFLCLLVGFLLFPLLVVAEQEAKHSSQIAKTPEQGEDLMLVALRIVLLQIVPSRDLKDALTLSCRSSLCPIIQASSLPSVLPFSKQRRSRIQQMPATRFLEHRESRLGCNADSQSLQS